MERRFYSSGSFAKLARTSRDALRLYNSLGLLTPVSRGENNYNYYSPAQLANVNFIRILQQLGMTLDEIRTLHDRRTPEGVNAFFEAQLGEIDKKVDEWAKARKLLLTYKKFIHDALGADEKNITIQFFPEENIILGAPNDYGAGHDDYGVLSHFYSDMRGKYPELDLNYPVWGRFSGERIRRGDWNWPDRYYFYNPDGHDKKPAALYAVGYVRGGYGQAGKLYERMVRYIADNGFEVSGDAYEEYPLNEVCISDDNNYLIRTMITVREKKQ